jgi:ABC-type uncharacterized transport system substrate-binding protein
MPGAKKVGVLINPKNSASVVQQKELKSTASAQGARYIFRDRSSEQL